MRILFPLLMCLPALVVAGEWEHELDPYYSNVSYYQTLDASPVPELGTRSEHQVYRDLFFRSYLPRFVLVEASVNPLPLLGVVVKDKQPDAYDDAEVSDNFNLVETVTAGFEEPYALSLFLGNMVKYTADNESRTQSKGFMGYLLSVGNKHIRQNAMLEDNWYELEWKLKGDQVLTDINLSWSFRTGIKMHDNNLITDEAYVALKRERVQLHGDVLSWEQNGGIEFVYRVDKNSGASIGQQLIIDKKLPLAGGSYVLSLGFGVVRDTRAKYKGKYEAQRAQTSFVLRPSISF
ncbi:MAG: hypothetical protein H7A08_01680 [Oceanospirillaceae bacterium]|nr:hypothetical protein [Oceanospirillaceae bacterium]